MTEQKRKREVFELSLPNHHTKGYLRDLSATPIKCSHCTSAASTLSCRIQGVHTILTRETLVAKNQTKIKVLFGLALSPVSDVIQSNSIQLGQHKPTTCLQSAGQTHPSLMGDCNGACGRLVSNSGSLYLSLTFSFSNLHARSFVYRAVNTAH